MLLQPNGVAPAGVGKWQEVWEIVAVGGNGFGHGGFALAAEVELLRVLADEECETQVLELFADFRMPEWGAFRTWREVATFDVGAWVAEAHRNEGEAFWIVELLGSDIEPTPKTVATWIGPGLVINVR